MSLDDVIGAMQALGMKKDDMWLPLDKAFDWEDIDKAMDGITDKGGILNSLFASLSNGVKSLGTAFKGFLLSPAAKIVGVMLAIATAVKFLDWAIVTPKEATEAMTESFGEFENAQNEVEALNSELQKTKDSIAELQAKGNLSLVDKEELRKLKETQKTLEAQKIIAEKLASSKARHTAQSAAVAYDKNYGRFEISDATLAEDKTWIDAYKTANGSLDGAIAQKGDISAQIALLQEYQTQLDSVAAGSVEWTNWNDKINTTTASIWEQADALMEQKTILEESKKAIEDNGGRLTAYQQSALDNITSSLDYIYKEMSPETWKQMQIDDLFSTDQFSNTKQELTGLAKEYSNLADFTNAAINAYGELNTALLGKGIKMSDIAENIFAEAGIIDTEAVRKQLKETLSDSDWADTLSKEELELVYKIILETDEANFTLEQWKNTLEEYKAMQALDHGVDITVEQEGLEKVKTAISENTSEFGLLTETINSLRSRYRLLGDEFDDGKLFENTANGVRLNTQYMGELEEKYQALKKTDLDKALAEANKRLDEANMLLGVMSGSEFEKAYQVRAENAREEVETIEQLISQYKALNGAYAKAVNAASTPDSDAMAENVKTMYKSMQEARKAGRVGTDDFRSFLELMTGDDFSTQGSKELATAFDSLRKGIEVFDGDKKLGTLKQSISSFFTEGQQGAKNFVTALDRAGELLGNPDWVTNQNGVYEINVDSSQIATALGISEELVSVLMQGLEAYGFISNFDITPTYDSSGEVKDNIEQTTKALENAVSEKDKLSNIKPIEIDVNNKPISQLKDQVSSIEGYIKTIQKNKDITPEYKKAVLNDAEEKLRLIYTMIQEQSGQRVDISNVADEYQNIAQKVNEYWQAVTEHNIAKVFGNSQEIETTGNKINEILGQISEMDVAKEFGLNFDVDKSGELESLKAQLEKGVQFPLKPTDAEEFNAIIDKINAINGEVIEIKANVDGMAKLQKLADLIASINSKSVTVSVNTSGGIKNLKGGVLGYTQADGTAFVGGTAFSKGNWGLSKNINSALMGELGQEIIVRDGKWFSVGDYGAEFVHGLRKNDIIFNAEQSKQLLQQGKITRGRRRGKAFVNGTTSGYAFNLEKGGFVGSASSNSNANNNKSSNQNQDNLFDWIEILIDRIERAIDRLDKQASNVFDSWENRSKSLNTQKDLLLEEIDIQKKAYERYLKQANSVGLDESYADKVRKGTIDIENISDAELKENIENYKEWYEKALDCKYAVDDLTESLNDCYQTAFDNVVTRYDQLVAIVEHSQAMLDESIAQSEARGHLISQKYYEMQIANEKELIEQQKQKREELIKTRDTALKDGVIVEGSEAWMEMNEEIDSCTEAIAESNTAIIEFNNSIQEVNWEIFDLIQEKISNVSDEAEFLINLLSNNKLFDNEGQITSDGLVTLGLYGQRYNTYLAQAAMYADELVKINNQIADDANNQTLIERRQELLELQQENILAAEDEKQAITDLIGDAFEAQLESLQELIDTYNDALDAQKDLYDYQKKVAEQTKNISQLEKQLAVYQGSDSEELQAKVQEIKVSLDEAKSELEETQYDKFVDDQQKLLDDLYANYEDLINERLDNTDALVEEIIEKINLNADVINQTLAEKADSIGYTLSQDMQSIWNGESGTNNILTTYGEGILNATTTVVTTLNTINSNLMNMVDQLNNLADMDISAIPVTGAYKDGKRKVVNDENAWTQENETEYIVRPSDGAILTPVAQDDSILDSYASGNIWKMANNPSKFIRENLKTGITSTPVSGNKNTTITQNFEKIIFDMPNVTSYSEMLESMKRDKNFERLVMAFTTDQLAGKSSMRVSKSF